ncbi:MAG: hypothetical protein U0942_00015 [Parvibaculum sp.]|uniref:hypothetical protein n=1 Tax=Parvibaculum sp. TaxID=2024848 RepID=UPI002AB8574E|nr:hypothetical protein [Parvibaculum sp.]MDZ4379705.1 hypothetical protein [Parvibaculum sp.]
MERWVGIAVSGEQLTLVDATVEVGKPLVINFDKTFKLQKGPRPEAYKTMHHQVFDYIKTNKIDLAVIKASAVSQSAGKAHLNAAELRGVVMAAAAAATQVSLQDKAQISKTFGERKFDAYLKDETFWSKSISGVTLRGGSRDAALILLAQRGK